MNKDYSEQMT